jgi:hypothetical protein
VVVLLLLLLHLPHGADWVCYWRGSEEEESRLRCR